jgi:hypothetical protein
MNEIHKYLEKYRGKSIDDVIAIESDLHAKKLANDKLKEDSHQKLLKEILDHKYYKINFNDTSISYVEITSIYLNSIIGLSINTYIGNDDKIMITIDKNRKLNDLWFTIDSHTKTNKITKEQYLKMVDLFESTKKLLETRL